MSGPLLNQYGQPLNTGRYVSGPSRDAGAYRGTIANWRPPRLVNRDAEIRERLTTQRRAADLSANDWAAKSGIRTAEGRDALQRLLDATADIFIADVACQRGCDAARVTEQFGRGGVMLAAEAVRAGMAGAVGSLENVIAALSAPDSVIEVVEK